MLRCDPGLDPGEPRSTPSDSPRAFTPPPFGAGLWEGWRGAGRSGPGSAWRGMALGAAPCRRVRPAPAAFVRIAVRRCSRRFNRPMRGGGSPARIAPAGSPVVRRPGGGLAPVVSAPPETDQGRLVRRPAPTSPGAPAGTGRDGGQPPRARSRSFSGGFVTAPASRRRAPPATGRTVRTRPPPCKAAGGSMGVVRGGGDKFGVSPADAGVQATGRRPPHGAPGPRLSPGRREVGAVRRH